MISRTDLIIVGASARAAAFSALRAGLTPWCVDLFADRDLARICTVKQLPPDQYPQGIPSMLSGFPATAPFMITGGLENHPSLIQSLQLTMPYYGSGTDRMQNVKNPKKLHEVFEKFSIPHPKLLSMNWTNPQGTSWLEKPLRGSGGKGITPWQATRPKRKSHYYQEFVDGVAHSAVFLGRKDGASLLGVTRQLVGEKWLQARPFCYCGSIGPVRLAQPTHEQVERIGTVLADSFGLSGLFGVDFVLRDETPFPIEVNPRYTASVEVLEYATGCKALRSHVDWFEGRRTEMTTSDSQQASGFFGKAILFAARESRFPATGPWSDALSKPFDAWEPPEYADIPQPGAAINANHPMMTVFAAGRSEKECLDHLQQKTTKLNNCLDG